MSGVVIKTADQIRRRKKRYRIYKIALAILIVLLVIAYFIVSVIYNGYNFTITLDKNLYYENKIVIYDDENYKIYRKELRPESLEYFDNISYKWLPKDLDKKTLGSHNGKNYFAYTFYIENMGEYVEDYHVEVTIDDVVKNVDEAIRFRIYYDGVETTYAKKSELTGKPEEGTKSFVSDNVIMTQHVEEFGPGEKHRYTIVIWLEGSDLECTNNIIGGEFRASMQFYSEFLNDGGK